MKLLVFAHKPPPHHGQSYMVQLLLNKLQASEVKVYHVDCRLSTSVEDIGSMRLGKLGLLVKYCFHAIWYRLRYGVNNFYFVPATPNRGPLYRDWIVMALCRPFFRNIIFHWHAVGLGDWLEQQAKPWERWISKRLIYRPELSMVLGEFNRRDAEQIKSQRIAVVPNGIPDPCPDFDKNVLPLRLARAESRKKSAGDQPHVFRVLFISLCFSEKGLFDAVEAIAIANRKLQGTPFCVKLTVAGTFFREDEKKQFEQRIEQADLRADETRSVEYKGFVSGEVKNQLMREHDCLCFPTWYSAESFGLVLAEGMAYGMSLVSTKWRTIPEVLPPGYEGLVDPRSPAQIAEKLLQLLTQEYDPRLRARFLEHYTEEKFVARIEAALKELSSQAMPRLKGRARTEDREVPH